jgi:hypothetical protein
MEHSYFQDRLSAYHDNELPLQEKVVVEEHVRGCAECQVLMEEYAKLDQLVIEHGQLADTDYWEKAAQRIDRAIAAGGHTEIDHALAKRRKGGLSWKLLAAAASVVIVGYIGINKDKFLSPDKQTPMMQAPGALQLEDSNAAVKLQADTVEPLAQSTAAAKRDAGRVTGIAEGSKSESSRDHEARGGLSSREMKNRPLEQRVGTAEKADLKDAANEKIATMQSADFNAAAPSPQLAPAPAMNALSSDTADNVERRKGSTEAASLQEQALIQDTGLGLAYWSGVRDSMLPLAEAEHKAKNVVEMGKSIISGYDKAERKPNRLAETAEPTPDARLAEACYWIASLTAKPEEKAQAIATLRKIGDRSAAPLKDTVQSWIKELTTP